MSRDLPCVFHARDVDEANIVVNWLAEHDIPAMVKNQFMAQALPGADIFGHGGIEVCVVDPAFAERAVELLREHDAELQTSQAIADNGEPIDATCDECGVTSRFPARCRGRVETCPACGKYVDVPE